MVSQMETISPARNDAVLPESLQTIVQAIRTSEEITPSMLRRIVSEANIDADELMPWKMFDQSPADSYGRRLVCDGGFFEMIESCLRSPLTPLQSDHHRGVEPCLPCRFLPSPACS